VRVVLVRVGLVLVVPVSQLLGLLGALFRLVSCFLGLIGPLPREVGGPCHLVGTLLRHSLLVVVRPFTRQISGLLGELSAFLRLGGVLL